MDRSRLSGIVLCLAALVLAVVFLWGLAARNYLALAIPVGAAFLGAMALIFWIGWTLATTEAPAPEKPTPQEPKASPPEQK